MDYEKFLKHIEEMLKIKITNYRMTENDLFYIIKNTYMDIATKVNLDFIRQNITLDKEVDQYDLDASYVSINDNILLDTIAIEDYDRLDITSLFYEHAENVFSMKDKELFYQSFEDGDVIYFKRIIIPDIKVLSPYMYMLLLPSVIQGCIYHTQDALPSSRNDQGGVEETNLHYQRYFKEIESLKNRLPQRI